MPPKAKGESKRGLVVTLVFFILATIGLGLSTYYGFAEQDKKDAAVRDQKDKADLATKERDFYRFMVALLMSYLDKAPDATTPTGAELTAANRTNFDTGAYPDAKLSALETMKKDLAVFRETLKRVVAARPSLAWDPAKNAPKENYESIVKAQAATIADFDRRVRAAEDLSKDEQQKRTAAEKARDDYRKAKDDSIEKLKLEFKEERDNFVKRNNELLALLKKVEDKKNDDIVKPLEEERDKLRKLLTTASKERDDANAKLLALQAKIDVRSADKVGDPTPRGKVARVHINPSKLTIDLGRRDGLTPQTTFAVHGLQPNGKPRVRSKANVEVLTVGETTSEVLVTAVFHPDPEFDNFRTGERKKIDVLSKDNTDPVIAGDVLINPLWNPNVKTHIAIAGNLELASGGVINMTSLIRLLEQMNVVVDAYVDTTDGTIKGSGMTRRTDYILWGNKPTGKEPGSPRDEETLKKIGGVIDGMIAEARSNGIRVMPPKRFFQETGFNLPRNIVSE